MPTFTKHVFSELDDGHPVNVGSTSAPGTLIHTVGATATDGSEFDSVYLFMSNSTANSQLVTVLFGGTSTDQHNVTLTLAARDGPNLVVPGWPLTGTDSTVYTFTSTSTEGVVVTGYVNRATATA